jgi:hypothetical protein
MTPEEYNELLGLITDFISKNGKELKNFKYTTDFFPVRKGVIVRKSRAENIKHLERCLKLWN